MARPAIVPLELTAGPFTLDEALRVALTKDQLAGTTWRRLGPRVYVWSGVADGPLLRLRALVRRLPASSVLSGRTAAWLLGLDAALSDPVEITLPASSRTSRLVDVLVRRETLGTDEKSTRHGLPVTSAVRTVADLGRRSPLVEAVVLLDAALHYRVISLRQMQVWISRHAGSRGIANLRRATDLAEPATESVMETRLRLLLVLAGLPRPEVQVSLCDRDGRFLARPDLFYPVQGLALEYDGVNHRDRLAADNRRQNRLLDAGYRLLRFTAADVLEDPGSVVDLVTRALSTGG
jgi:hypothetical protein